MVVETEGALDAGLGERISSATGNETRTIAKHGLGGDVASWLLVGNFIISSLAALAPILSGYLKERRVKSIKVGDLVIENPTEEHIAQILGAWGQRPDGSA